METNKGVGFLGVLTVLFIALKLTSVIDWSWAWVLAPLWLGVAGWVIGMAVIMALIWRLGE